MKLLSRVLLLGFCVVTLFSARSNAAPHRYDHVVIVVEENRTLGEIIGDTSNAPYLNTLANGGVWLSNIYALVHPSQPNYIHLFSGERGRWDVQVDEEVRECESASLIAKKVIAKTAADG